MLSIQFIVVHTVTELHEKYFHENILFGHKFVSGYSTTDSTYCVHYCFVMSGVSKSIITYIKRHNCQIK